LSILGDYEQFELSEMDGEGEGRQFELYENISEFIDNYEEKNNIKKTPKRKKQKERELSLLEELFEEEEDLDKL
jgi:hypothetical protein